MNDKKSTIEEFSKYLTSDVSEVCGLVEEGKFTLTTLDQISLNPSSCSVNWKKVRKELNVRWTIYPTNDKTDKGGRKRRRIDRELGLCPA